MRDYRRAKLIFSDQLPEPGRFGPNALLLFDRVLNARVEGFSEWAAAFPASYELPAGEGLKDLHAFPAHLEKILQLTQEFAPRETTLVVAGGGSVGDFGGFVASILKRGVKLVQIPSTWLAAIDSSHGGKNALNVGGIKNQVGTFHFPSEIHLTRSLLAAQDSERARDAFGELAKIAVIDGKSWWKQVTASKEKDGQLLWKWLKHAIAAKYRIVARDPWEEKELRKLLNLGHTFGHALEAFQGLSHGAAVAQGMLFSMEWSRKRKILKEPAYRRVHAFLTGTFQFTPLQRSKEFKKIPETDFLRLIRNDKKRNARSEITEAFIQDFGKTILVSVSPDELAEEAKAQGWVGEGK